MLEEEIYGENSPIWEADFTMPASDGAQLGHQTGEYGRKDRIRTCWCFVLEMNVLYVGLCWWQ